MRGSTGRPTHEESPSTSSKARFVGRFFGNFTTTFRSCQTHAWRHTNTHNASTYTKLVAEFMDTIMERFVLARAGQRHESTDAHRPLPQTQHTVMKFGISTRVQYNAKIGCMCDNVAPLARRRVRQRTPRKLPSACLRPR